MTAGNAHGPNARGLDAPQDLRGNVLVIGFGRIGQIASQAPPARAFDRQHALALVQAGVDDVIRETFDSALGRRAALAPGATPDEADALTADVRHRDAERHALETSGDRFAGRALLLGNVEHVAPPSH